MHLRAEGRLELPKPTLGYVHFGLAAMGNGMYSLPPGQKKGRIRHGQLTPKSTGAPERVTGLS